MGANKTPLYVRVLLVGWFIFLFSLATAAFNPGWKASTLVGLAVMGYGVYLMLRDE